MQITSTIKKLLSQYTPEQLVRFIAHEVEQQAKHYQTVGAPIRAAYSMRQVAYMREMVRKLDTMPYRPEDALKL